MTERTQERPSFYKIIILIIWTKFCDNIFRLNIPGEKHGFVILFDAEDVKTLYSNDGRVPQIPGFDMFEFIRKNAMKDRYISAGLINNTEDWYSVRHQVQQDMMRPKSALYYVDEMEDIAVELADKIAELKGKDGEGIEDIHPIIQEYALEAVGCVFLNARLGALKGMVFTAQVTYHVIFQVRGTADASLRSVRRRCRWP